MMLPPFNDKFCPQCKTRQLTDLQIDCSKNQLGTVFFYCDECLEIYASEGVHNKNPRMDVVQFTGIKSTIKDSIDFYETMMHFYKLQGEYLDGQARNSKLMLMALHVATILKYEAWGRYRDCEMRIERLRKFEDDQRNKKRKR